LGIAVLPVPTLRAGPPAPAGFRTDRILIKPAAGVSLDQLAKLDAKLGTSVLRTFTGIGNMQVIQLPAGASVPGLVTAYRQSKLVAYAEPDYFVQPLLIPNDFYCWQGNLWGLRNTGIYGGMAGADIDAQDAWDIQYSASNVLVAVTDSGARYTHQDLAGNMWTNPVDGSFGTNVLDGNNNPWDTLGHGTYVAGIIGAVGSNSVGVVGVAWRVQLMACRFVNQLGADSGSVSDAITCIDYAINNRAKIINASWGGYTFNSSALYDAIQSCRDAGIIFVTATGNDGNNNDVNPLYPASSHLDNLLAVAATDRNDALASWSNFGLTNVDLAAPGETIFSTGNSNDTDYSYISGTSMAAAYVSGACAVLWARYPDESYQQIIQRVLTGVDPLPTLAGKCVAGGRLNLLRALGGTVVSSLIVAPTNNFSPSGSTGGNFRPSNTTYTLTNGAARPLDWSVFSAPNWVGISVTNGLLAPGATTNVQISITTNAQSFPPGSYIATVNFSNVTSLGGTTSRLVSLQITSHTGYLAVLPQSNFLFGGTMGRPFAPSNAVYTLYNSGGTGFNWAITNTQGWIGLSLTNGNLPAGAATNVQVLLNTNAQTLATGSHTNLLSFNDLTSGQGNTSRLVALMVAAPGVLLVTPGTGVNSGGYVGGPFTPSNTIYTLTNTGAASLEWSLTSMMGAAPLTLAVAAPNWISASVTNGILAAGGTTSVTISINTNAQALAPGGYTNVLVFTNAASGLGGTNLLMTLQVAPPPGILVVAPSGDFNSSGVVGGPFSPSNMVYTLTNTGGGALDWSLTSTEGWSGISASNGTLPGFAITNITVFLNTNAESLAPGRYTNVLAFTNGTSGLGNTNLLMTLQVAPASGILTVTPSGDFSSSGAAGGPFAPSNMVYTLTNTGGSTLNWLLTGSQSWADISASNGTLPAFTVTNITAFLTTNAQALAPGSYTNVLAFTNVTSGLGGTNLLMTLQVAPPPGFLVIASGGDFNSSGVVGGPFSPSNMVYTLTNTGGSALTWTLTSAESWAGISAFNGTLPGSTATNIITFLTTNAQSLAPGSYTNILAFTNATSGLGNTNLVVTLQVARMPGILLVAPSSDFNSSGVLGGPFAPSNMVYTLTNSAGNVLNWSLTSTQSWAGISTSNGMLPGFTATNITAFLTTNSQALVPGSYTNILAFTNATSGLGNTNLVMTLQVAPAPGILAVTPSGDFIASGAEGGPFAPSNMVYTLTNTGGSALNWSLTSSQNWADIFASNGMLPGFTATNITAFLTTNAQALAPGSYTNVLAFTNATSGLGNTNLLVSLLVNSTPGYLLVGPASDFNSSGVAGGPFTPSNFVYTLENSGGSPLDWVATNSQNWASLSVPTGTLTAAASTNVNLFINTNSQTLAPGTYTNYVVFSNPTAGQNDTIRLAILQINNPPALQLSIAQLTNQIVVTVVGRPLTFFVLQRGDDLSTWTPFATNQTGPDGTHSAVETNNAPAAHRFFRALIAQ
jgi:subtilisin family serine protease